MKCKFNKYLVVLLLGFFTVLSVFTKTIENYKSALIQPRFEQVREIKHEVTFFKNLVVDTESFKENKDIAEIEIEEDETSFKKFLTQFKFSDTYLSSELSENQISVIKNGLTSCNYKKYLTSTHPINIKFCVYRI